MDMHSRAEWRGMTVFAIGLLVTTGAACAEQSIARQWNEELLDAIRADFARPTVHARNLFHTAIVMWDAWAAYDDDGAETYLHHQTATAVDVEAARNETISHAVYNVLKARFANSPGAAQSLPSFDAKMDELGFDKTITSGFGDTPAALGNSIAATVLSFYANDGSNEANEYVNQYYQPVNPPLIPALPGNPDILDPNRWQPLALDFFRDQAGNIIIGGFPEFLSPEWGQVTPFALKPDDLTIYNRDNFDYQVYHDPGPPPLYATLSHEYYLWGTELVAVWSNHLDPSDGVMIDISPASLGNSPLPEADDYLAYYDFFNGGDWGTGYDANPVTGAPYTQQLVPRGDYARVLAEFWADGPDSETPPGHWFTIANYVSDHVLTVKQIGGEGPVLDDLQWDVKLYFTLGGAMHDCAVCAWGIKGWYDYTRPISALRYLADLGQSSDPLSPSYHPSGIRLYPGLIDVVTTENSAAGQPFQGFSGDVGSIVVNAWRGPSFIFNPATTTADVGWILAEEWWPYQRPSFVTPPFAGYVSGHSTYSRAASEVMTRFTGSPYFPGGLGEFHCPQNEFLVFEDGPSVNLTLQWTSYYDASDQTSLSRIWGGIHPPADDLPGRIIGAQIGAEAYNHAITYYGLYPGDLNADGEVGPADFVLFLAAFSSSFGDARFDPDADYDGDYFVGLDDYSIWLQFYRDYLNEPQRAAPTEVLGDYDNDFDVDQADFANFQRCVTGPDAGPPAIGCELTDFDQDGDVDPEDFDIFKGCQSGPNVPLDLGCQ